jgi:hypothetical protein
VDSGHCSARAQPVISCRTDPMSSRLSWSLVRRIRAVYREKGLGELLNRATALAYRRLLRPALPTLIRPRYNGIPIARERKLFDSRLPKLYRIYDVEELRDVPGYESGLVGRLRQDVQSGDRVVIVGGGLGVTAVIAAQQAGPAGSVCVYESTATHIRQIQETARLNGMGARVSVTHAVVGRAVAVPGDVSQHGPVLPASAIPPCDVLEMDCEGAENVILSELVIRPRVILVETHGLYGARTVDVEAKLREMSYEVARVGVAEDHLAEACEKFDIHIVRGRHCHL